MDSAKTEKDQGTFWAKEDRSWLWYNDTIESHAFALRVLMELDPQNPKRRTCAVAAPEQKLGQWKSTRATAEVIYSLVHYLRAEKALGVKEEATVSIGPMVAVVCVRSRQVCRQDADHDSRSASCAAKHHTVKVEKATKGYMFASATWHFRRKNCPRKAAAISSKSSGATFYDRTTARNGP